MSLTQWFYFVTVAVTLTVAGCYMTAGNLTDNHSEYYTKAQDGVNSVKHRNEMLALSRERLNDLAPSAGTDPAEPAVSVEVETLSCCKK